MIADARALALRDALTQEHREYWNNRGVSNDILDILNIGYTEKGTWKWFTIPIIDFDGEFLFFKLKKAPGGAEKQPKAMTFPKGNKATLYPLPYLHGGIHSIFLCEGEPDVLALLSQGIEAVSSTHGVRTFPEEFLMHFPANIDVTCCFDSDDAGREGVKRVEELFKEKRSDITFSVFEIPEECPGKDITDYILWKYGPQS